MKASSPAPVHAMRRANAFLSIIHVPAILIKTAQHFAPSLVLPFYRLFLAIFLSSSTLVGLILKALNSSEFLFQVKQTSEKKLCRSPPLLPELLAPIGNLTMKSFFRTSIHALIPTVALLLLLVIPQVNSEIRDFSGVLAPFSFFVHYSTGYLLTPGSVDLSNLEFSVPFKDGYSPNTTTVCICLCMFGT
jgi:hypothetical protein